MYTAYALLVLVYQIFPIVTTIAGLAINDGEVPSQFCKSVPGRAGTIGTMGSLAIVVLFCAWKMRHVHDAYFLKKELTFLGIETLFVAAPALTATFLTVSKLICTFLTFLDMGMGTINGNCICVLRNKLLNTGALSGAQKS